jgi:hypothetical protein
MEFGGGRLAMIRTLPLVVFLGFGVLTFAQEHIVPLSSPSEPGAPVTLYGSLTAQEDQSTKGLDCSCIAHLSIVNASAKPIIFLMTEVSVEIEGDDIILARYASRGADDYFLKADLFEPNSSKTLDDKIVAFERRKISPESNFEPTHLTAIAQVLFVQFADGSTWGDLEVAKPILDDRAMAWKELLALDEAYRTQGGQQLLALLKEPSAGGPWLGSLTSLASTADRIEPLVAEMGNLLRLGHLHLQDMGGSLNPAAISY